MMELEHVVQLLMMRLREPLPGDEERRKMSPSLRIPGSWKPPDMEKASHAGVLIMLYPHLDTVYTALMLRNTDGHAHSGQSSLPGGKIESADEHLVATALRETREEFGINDDEVWVFGSLSRLYIPASYFWVLPTIGILNSRPQFRPDHPMKKGKKECALARIQNVLYRFSRPPHSKSSFSPETASSHTKSRREISYKKESEKLLAV